MSNRAKLFLPGIFFIAMLGLLLFGLSDGRDPTHVPSALANRPVPEFMRPDLFDPAATISSLQLRGRVFLVNYWATWCPPCHAEHPFLVDISKRAPDVTLVGVSYEDDPELARELLAERGNPFAISLIDADGSLGIDFGITAPPETFVVDSSGTIRYRHVGVIDNTVWTEVLEPLIARIQ